MKFSKYNLTITDESLPEGKYLLCNTFSGATFLVDEEILRMVKKNDLSQFSEDAIGQFLDTGVLVENDNLDEAKVFNYFYEREKYDNSVLSLTILLTMACNLRCIYCYEGAGEISNESLSDQTRENILNFIKTQAETRKVSTVSLWLFGGEPLLDLKSNIYFLESVKLFCEKTNRKFLTQIVTNGILCNKENLEVLVRFNCQYVQITLDGIKAIHDTRRIYKGGKGSFDEVLAGVKNVVQCKELNNPIIRINIDKTNIDKTFELLEYLHLVGLSCCPVDFGIVKGTTEACASYKSNCFSDDELGNILYPLWEKAKALGFPIYINPTKKFLFCGLYSDSSFTIAPNGDLYKCWDFVNDKKHRIARISDNGQVIDTTYAYFDWMTRTPYNISECRECVYLPACGGGCVGAVWSETGSYHVAGCYKMKGVFEKQILERFKNEFKKEPSSYS